MLRYDEDVAIRVGQSLLAGKITVPNEPSGVVVFAHGSGSSRHRWANRFVTTVLNEAGIATLLLDLLTRDEEGNRANVFDVELLAQRLVSVTRWLASQDDVASLAVGYFAASTATAAALRAAADARIHVSAVISRGGRPDLAGSWLTRVRAATLLIVGERDELGLELNRRAQAAIPAECRVAVVPDATPLFEEPGALEKVAALARDWFVSHLATTGTADPQGPAEFPNA